MNKKYYFVAASLLWSASPAMAQQWQQLGNHGPANFYFMNPKTLSVTAEKTVKSWTKREMDVDTAAMAKAKLKPDQVKGSTSIVTYNEFDCEKRQNRTLAGISYDNTRRENKEVERTDWRPVEPGTLEADLLGAVCRAAKKSK